MWFQPRRRLHWRCSSPRCYSADKKKIVSAFLPTPRGILKWWTRCLPRRESLRRMKQQYSSPQGQSPWRNRGRGESGRSGSGWPLRLCLLLGFSRWVADSQMVGSRELHGLGTGLDIWAPETHPQGTLYTHLGVSLQTQSWPWGLLKLLDSCCLLCQRRSLSHFLLSIPSYLL